MISVANRRIFICGERVDMRKSFGGLTGLVLSEFRQDPRSGDAFVFVGKRGNLLKVLVWDGDGFWCCAKRLAQGTFAPPQARGLDGGICALEMTRSDWQLFLDGVIVREKRHLPRLAR